MRYFEFRTLKYMTTELVPKLTLELTKRESEELSFYSVDGKEK